MRKNCCFIFLLCVGFATRAQLNIYSALTIPDSLKKDADVVVREENIKFTLKDINSAKYEVHQVITILNEGGKQFLKFEEYSDKFDYIDDAEIKVFDAFGKKQNSYSKKEMINESYGSGLVVDGKITAFHVNAPSYPITVEINYTRKYKGLFNLPDNYFQQLYQSVQNAVFDVEVPTELDIRYKLMNCSYEPVITNEKGNKLYHWQVQNLKAKKGESHAGGRNKYLPVVFLAPNKFSHGDFEGDMTSWKNFGEWYSRLIEKTVELKEDRKAFFKALVKDAKTDNEKAAILYKYLQNNMRFVSIQLGIGGLRPFPASFVDEKKYGDCKALSNFLKSALDAVGIKSNLIIIYRNYQSKTVDEKFPINAFNHIILSIPQPKDTVWLECTSTTLPFARLDESTLNRTGVMVTENGGVLVSTPVSNYKINTDNIFTAIEMNEDGGAKVKTTFTSTGESREYMLHYFNDMMDDEKRRFFITNLEWKQPDVINFSDVLKTEKAYNVTSDMEYEKIFSFKAGNKFFLEPRLSKIFKEDIPETDKRQRDYYFEYPFQTIDTTVYHFTAGFTAENIPKDKKIDLPFAAYNCAYKWDAAAATITTIATLQIKQRVVKAEDYAKLLDFKKQVLADVNDKIVMKKE